MKTVNTMTQNPIFVTEESRWNAVVERDQTAEGAFYYAVKTTGVFCRPGCSSRLPNRENVEFFETGQMAEAAGYRPCKRCTPLNASPQEQSADIIVRACRHLEQAETPPTLDELAAKAGLSPWHFHRLFKKMVGVTPKQYASAQQTQRFRQGLEGKQTVTEAIYEAGFGSSSRAYEHARDHLAMTPTRYKQGAKDMTIRYGAAPCFLGWVIVAATEHGICAIEFGDDPSILPAQVQHRFPKAKLEQAEDDFSATVQIVVDLIDSPKMGIDLPLDIQGTAFQKRVWNALRQIPLGSTASYGEIADRIGQPKAVRAVAQACGANKLGVAVPCHRVVRNDGQLGGYRWGVERKQALLDLESGGNVR